MTFDGTVRIVEESPAGAFLGELTLALARPQVTVRELIAMAVRERRPADAAAEIAKAHDAFERGNFLVLVDARQVESLDERVDARAGVVTFIRLVALAGG